jgi:hypothetical protein
MKRIIITLSMVFTAVAIFAQKTYEAKPGDVLPMTVTGTGVTWNWTSSNTSVVSLTGAATATATATVSALATDMQTSTVSVVGTSAALCPSDAFTITFTVKVTTPFTYSATIGAISAICYNNTAAATVTINTTGATSIKYYIDLNNNGVQDKPAEADLTQTVSGTTASITTAALTTNAKLVVLSVTDGTTTSASGVSKDITVNAKPTITDVTW